MTEDYKVGHLYPLMLNGVKDRKWGIPLECDPVLCVAVDFLHKTATFLSACGALYARDGVTPCMYEYDLNIDEDDRNVIVTRLNEDEIGAPQNAWTCGTMIFVGHEEVPANIPEYNWWDGDCSGFILKGFEHEFDEDEIEDEDEDEN